MGSSESAPHRPVTDLLSHARLYAAMNDPAVRLATYADVLAAPDDKIAEVIHGVLHLSPRPAGPHGAAALGLSGDLRQSFGRGGGGEGPGGWLFAIEPELHLDGHILVPDVAGWRRERRPLVERTPFVTILPDWVCEILSPRTSRTDRTQKRPLYAALGVPYLWLVDPDLLTLEVSQLVGGRWSDVGAYADNARPRAVPFDAIEFELGNLWADVEQAPEI